MGEDYVLEWNQSKNTFRVQTCEKMLAQNRVAYTKNELIEYVALYIGTQDECVGATVSMRGTLEARDL